MTESELKEIIKQKIRSGYASWQIDGYTMRDGGVRQFKKAIQLRKEAQQELDNESLVAKVEDKVIPEYIGPDDLPF